MALFNHAIKQVTAKLVYFGPGLCGKTTNLQWVHDHVAFKLKGDLVSLKTKTDRTLFFDVLPVEIAPIRGMRSRVQIYTVPGQVFYEATRRMVLKGADAVVFVADSQASMLDANAESLESLRRNLIANELDPNLPLVLQYNKRDLMTALSVDALNARLNPQGLPFYEAVAINGVGVEETLKKAMSLLFTSLSTLYDTQPATTPPATAQPATPPPAATAPAPAAVRAAAPAPAAPRSPAAAPVARPPAVRASATPPAAAPTPSRPAPSASRAAVVEPDRPPGPFEPAPPRIALGADQWLYLRDGEQRGPISFDDLVDLVLGSLPEDTAVWGGAITRWTPANLVPEIAEQIPPPLPMRRAREEDFPDFKTVSPMLRTALIADEDSSFRQSLALPLAAQGFKIFEARDGAEAWRLSTQHRPWVMLADLGMPEVDGFEFCRRVRANSLLSHRPLVFISGSDRYKDRYRALQLGADEFLSKQTPIRELLIRIQLLLTRFSDLESAPAKQPGTEKTAVGGALQGQIEVFGAAGVLQICSQGALTGIFSAQAREAGEEKLAVFGFRDGQIITATAQELTGPEAVYSFLAWDRGQFKFVPGDPGQGAPFAQSVEHLLLEGCRRVDEARQGAQDGADG